MPNSLDHVMLGSRDLDRGIAYVEERTGVRAANGGVHPGRGTRNALLSLGPQRYLEILALDPKQSELKWHPRLRELEEPRLIGWASRSNDITTLAKRLHAAAVAVDGPYDGSRARPDGKTLRWRNLDLKDDRGGLLPFFIEWSGDSLHPSVDAPAGCRLERFALQTPNPIELAETLRTLGVQAAIERGPDPQLRVRIAGPRGILEATS